MQTTGHRLHSRYHGGNVPATIISNMTGIRCEALKVSLRDDNRDSESMPG